MAYDLDQFIADCKTTLTAIPVRPAANRCAAISSACSPIPISSPNIAATTSRAGVKVLYEDSKLGFQVLAHINDKAHVSPPHDHGASWAIYGQATKYTDMTEWAREDDGNDPKHAKLKPAKKYRLTPGQAGIYQDGAIHSIDYPDYARFVRVTGTDLEKINRIKIDSEDRRSAADERPAGVVNLHAAIAMLRPVAPAAVKAMLGDGGELALIDVREELIFSRSHLLWARNVPLSRLELRFARLVPRKATRIVLVDDNDGLSERAAAVLAARRLLRPRPTLDGGNAAWAAAGFELFSGVNVPSKAFGEFIEHASHTPSIGADELNALMRAGTDMVVLDSRPYDEYSRISIPTGINVPGAELVLRAHDIAPSPDTLIVVNCAGRTRSIIGAQSLINAGVPNKVVALRNGTMGWHLAGFTCDKGKDARFPAVTKEGLAWAKSAIRCSGTPLRVSAASTAPRLNAGAPNDAARTTYVFDVRDPAEYEAGHFPGAISAPGGQLVQATDQYAGTLQARIVLVDDNEVRAVMTASWLKQMGWKDVAVLPEAGSEKGQPADVVLGTAPADASVEFSDVLAIDDVTVIDLSRSPDYRKGHIPGAWFAIRSRLAHALAKIPQHGTMVLTSEDGVLAGLAVEEARALTTIPVYWLKGGNAAWAAAGFPLSTDVKMADEPLDVWLKPYERPGDPKAAMNEYLSWEIDLLTRIERDGTTRFTAAAR